MTKAAVGFYWTLPVPWVGFTSLPEDIEAAVAASRTIRYQRELVRRYAANAKWRIMDEIAFLEMQPDRGNGMIEGPLLRAVQFCRRHDAILLTVDFAAALGWRGHNPLQMALEDLDVEHWSLVAEPVLIDGEPFDPAAHFTAWRAEQKKWTNGKAARQAVMIQEGLALRERGLTYAQIARSLNDRRIRSASGKPHTAESVRKAIPPATSGDG